MAIIIALVAAYFAKTYRQALLYVSIFQLTWSIVIIPISLRSSHLLQQQISMEVFVLGMLLGILRAGLLSAFFLFVKKKVVEFKSKKLGVNDLAFADEVNLNETKKNKDGYGKEGVFLVITALVIFGLVLTQQELKKSKNVLVDVPLAKKESEQQADWQDVLKAVSTDQDTEWEEKQPEQKKMGAKLDLLPEGEINSEKNIKEGNFELPFGLRFMMSKNQSLEQMKTLEQFKIKTGKPDSLVYATTNQGDNTKGALFLGFDNDKLTSIESMKLGMSKEQQGSYIFELVSQIKASLESELESISTLEGHKIHKIITPGVVVIISGDKVGESSFDHSASLIFYDKRHFTKYPASKIKFSSELLLEKSHYNEEAGMLYKVVDREAGSLLYSPRLDRMVNPKCPLEDMSGTIRNQIGFDCGLLP